jgi:hypothetical protein
MSKRHHVQRRKAYGRRQHEVRERVSRRPLVDPIDLATGDQDYELFAADDPDTDAVTPDRFAFLERPAARLRFALGD